MTSPRTASWKSSLLLFVGVWGIFTLCPPFTSFDSFWTVPVAVSILERGDTNIDEYLSRMPSTAGYAVECVAPAQPAVPYLDQPAACAAGHAYSFYPLMVSILILPVVAGLKLLVAVLPLAQLVGDGHPVIAGFLHGDFFAGHAVVEMLAASLICALAVLVMERVLAVFLPLRPRILFALLFAFGTGVWSTASRSLYQHGPLLLMLSLVLLLLVKGHIPYVSLPLAAAYTIRPTGAIWVVLITVFVAVHHRKQLLRFLLWSLPVAIPFLTYNLIVRHSLLPIYFTMSKAISPISYWEGFAAHLLSPSRGLFVCSPFLLASVPGAWVALRKNWMFPLTPYLLAGCLTYVVVCGAWWPGHSFGSRYLNDLSPVLVLLLVPAFEWWSTQRDPTRRTAVAAFAVAALWSVFVHAHGATSVAAQMWNVIPANVDQQPHRIWDWSDPQFWRF